MFSRRLFLLIIPVLFALVTACNSKQPAASPAPPLVKKEVPAEQLAGIFFNYEKQELQLTVISSGCTVKTDFSFVVNGDQLSINRLRKDDCKAMPEAVVLSFGFKEAGLDANKAYTVLNAFVANPNTANTR